MGRGQLRTPFRHKGAETSSGLASEARSLMPQLPPAHPTFSSPQRELQGPRPTKAGCLSTPSFVYTILGLRLVIVASGIHVLPQHLVGPGLSPHRLGHFMCVALGSTCPPP